MPLERGVQRHATKMPQHYLERRPPARRSALFNQRVAQTRPPGEAGRGGVGAVGAEVVQFGAGVSREPMPRDRVSVAAAAGPPRGGRGGGEDAGGLRKGEGRVRGPRDSGAPGTGRRPGGGAVTVRLRSSLKEPL